MRRENTEYEKWLISLWNQIQGGKSSYYGQIQFTAHSELAEKLRLTVFVIFRLQKHLIVKRQHNICSFGTQTILLTVFNAFSVKNKFIISQTENKKLVIVHQGKVLHLFCFLFFGLFVI